MTEHDDLRKPHLLGGGIYAYYDGLNIVLQEYEDGSDRIFLEPEFVDRLETFIQKVRDVQGIKKESV